MKSLYLLFLIVLAFTSNAQKFNHEARLYTGIQINKDLPKRFDVSLEYQFRLDRDFYRIRGSYLYGTIKYGLIKKYLTGEIEYRYSTSTRRDQHRFGIGLTAKYKYKKVKFSYRLSYQRQYEYFSSSYEAGHAPTNVIRNRIKAKWGFKKHWDVYASVEPFYLISNRINKIIRVRAVTGLGWEFKKKHKINVFYMFQTDAFGSNQNIAHITGLMYAWDLPKFKKKKAKDD